MGAFDLLDIASSGLGMHQTWLDALGRNIANANTIRSTDDTAFQAQMIIAEADPRGGVDVAGVALSTPRGRWSTTRTTRSPTRRATSALRRWT